jgi:hypothetical protein
MYNCCNLCHACPEFWLAEADGLNHFQSATSLFTNNIRRAVSCTKLKFLITEDVQ